MPLQIQRTKKDGRKRALSTVSNITNVQGPVASVKTSENASPSQRAGSNQTKPAVETQAQKPATSAKKIPDVFQFLDENDDESSSEATSDSSDSSESDSSEDEDPAPPRSVQNPTNIQAPKPRGKPVPHGVLVSGGNTPPKTAVPTSPTSKSPKEQRRPSASHAPSTGNQLQITRKQANRKPSPISTTYPVSGKGQLELSRPESYYGRDEAAFHRPPLPPSPPRSPEDSLHHTTPTKRRDSTASHVPSGYGLIASHITKSNQEDKPGFPPLYRRFESVNHRVLLHLQDEISQMEEDLHTLDEYEEMHRIGTAEQEGTKPLPASRRRDSQAQVYSSLHYRRMDLMGALIQKTEQYNNALSSYSKVLQTLPKASEKDIDGYRIWMKENHPIASSETRFLNHDADLVSLTPRLAAGAASAPVYMAIIIASGALLLPLLAFSMIAEFSGRLVVVTVVGGAAAAIAANYSAGIDTLVDSRDGWRCATIYFGFMTIAAMFIP
ncbi:hypothetical protein PENANT_c002G01623 [Penicillium antarcticum]|uniref:DUF6594 domain-containing protein n=1 Tax=Penicillium antarcticum TaxID=416450 RepID=A0A1V6QL48_9EURO|nr:uncharacterized protein N7508_008705 [Penicillium antarcticum]KAJ5293884.1 hypothetical protein N7508_008705 [Penicillium antarcticum]OQD89925.1 hypothetical protein PENANT_c002G01623 [Penicillium antarcticum]